MARVRRVEMAWRWLSSSVRDRISEKRERVITIRSNLLMASRKIEK